MIPSIIVLIVSIIWMSVLYLINLRKINKVAEALAERDTNIDRIDDDIDRTVDVVNYNSEELEKTVNGNVEEIEEINIKLKDNDEYIKMTGEELSELCERVVSVEGISEILLEESKKCLDNINTIDDVLGGIEDRTETVEEHLPVIGDRLRAIEEELLDNEINDDKMKECVEDLKDSQEFIYDTLISHINRSDELFKLIYSSVDKINSTIKNLCESLEDIYSYEESLEKKVDGNNKDFLRYAEFTDTVINDVSKRTGDLEDETKGVAKDLCQLRGELIGVSDRLKRESDRRRIDKLWREADERYEMFRRAREEGYPQEVLNDEYNSYLNYYSIASLSQQMFDGRVVPVRSRYND